MEKFALFLLVLLCTLSCQKDEKKPVTGFEKTAQLVLADSLMGTDTPEQGIALYEAFTDSLLEEKAYQAYVWAKTEQALKLQGNRSYEEAIDVLNEAISIGEKYLDTKTDTILAMAYHKKGIMYYYSYDFERTTTLFKQALDIREAVFDQYHPDVINGYHARGVCFLKIDDLQSAIESLKKSLDLQPSPPKDPYHTTLMELGNAYSRLGDSYQAEAYFKMALQAYKKRWEDNPSKIAQAYNNLAVFAIQHKTPAEVLEYTQAALAIYDTLSNKEKNSHNFANCYNNMGIAYQEMDSLDRALFYYTKAVMLNLKGGEKRESFLAKAYNNLGITYRKKGAFAKAIYYEKEAQKINERVKSRRASLARNYHNLGAIWADSAAYDQALQDHHRAIQLLVPSFASDDLAAIPQSNMILGEKLRAIKYLHYKAMTYRLKFQSDGLKNNLDAAYRIYDSLDVIIDKIRFSYLADDSKIDLAKHTKPVFEDAIKTSLELYQLTNDLRFKDQAFAYSEKSRAIILLETAKTARADQFANVDKSVFDQEMAVKKEIGELERKIYKEQNEEEPKEEKIESLRKELLKLNQSYEQLRTQLKKDAPSYFNMKYRTEVMAVKDIQLHPELLQPNQALLEYFIGEDQLYVFLITKDAFQIETIPLDFPLSDWISGLRYRIKNLKDGGTASDQQAYREIAWKLYEKIWQPFEEALPEKVLVVPDEALGVLPFDALLYENSMDANYKSYSEYPYLLKKHIISYAYSASLQQEMYRPMEKKVSNRVLAFAPGFLPPPIAKQTMAMLDEYEGARGVVDYLLPLNFSDDEVHALKGITRVKIYEDEKANKQTFLKKAGGYKFIHIATHGLVDNEEPDYSFIAFSQLEDALAVDELLFIKELYGLRLNAEMVVLSACETGIGKVRKGEGVVSLARGFHYAGARSIITTLWNTSDQLSVDFMRDFYTHLDAGMPKDEALFQTKLNAVNNNSKVSSPYHWAAYISLGKMSAVDLH